jgi:hypothetical protein
VPDSGLVEPGTAGVELGQSADGDAAAAEATTVEHVPIKTTGTRKR